MRENVFPYLLVNIGSGGESAPVRLQISRHVLPHGSEHSARGQRN